MSKSVEKATRVVETPVGVAPGNGTGEGVNVNEADAGGTHPLTKTVERRNTRNLDLIVLFITSPSFDLMLSMMPNIGLSGSVFSISGQTCCWTYTDLFSDRILKHLEKSTYVDPIHKDMIHPNVIGQHYLSF